MQLLDSRLTFSATDLSNYLACPQLSLLDRRGALGGPKPPIFDDPAVDVLRARGLEHEHQVRASLEGRVTEIDDAGDAVGATVDAMRSGAEIIYQGVLHADDWIGRPDFLVRVDGQSRFGDWSYEVIDAKLSREAKGGALLQLLVYADLLEQVQGVAPERVHLALGGPEPRTVSFRVADYAAYFRSLRRRFKRHFDLAPQVVPLAPDPVPHCEVCAWQTVCDRERREADHLSLVAGITALQRRVLREAGVDTVQDLAALDLFDPPVYRIGRNSLRKIREQARIQVEGRREGAVKYEFLLPVVQGEGLAALPPPSEGDLFFDLEGDPYALSYGLEYLFGYVDRKGNYRARWALDRQSEKQVFEEFIDFVMERIEAYPDLHVYHFAPYETSALKRLMGWHATREVSMDRLLRGGVFVDLHRVVKQALRASVESYSIKKLEPLYSFERSVDLRTAGSAIAHFEAWLELGGTNDGRDVLLTQIERYNADDCRSTLQLREWLEGRRAELAQITGAEVPRPQPRDSAPGESLAEHEAEVVALVDALTADVPVNPEERTDEQQARWLLAQLLGWHRREARSAWWEYFRWLELSDEELIEDGATLGGLEYVGVVGPHKRSLVHRYQYPLQDHALKAGEEPHDPETRKSAGTILAIDDHVGIIDLSRSPTSTVPHPRALIPHDIVRDTVLRESLQRVAGASITSGTGDAARYRAAADLLMRRSPRVGSAPGTPLSGDGEMGLDAAKRLVAGIERSVLPVQGPPGAGKTYTGARMIVEALRLGKRVGVTATSHKVISTLLEEVCRAAHEEDVTFSGIQKTGGSDGCSSAEIMQAKSTADVPVALRSGDTQLAAGTAWLWAREDMVDSVDLLFIDEAGQFSLANALAVAPSAGSLVLLGDPKQLDQPRRGVHPPGADVSALGHLLGDHDVMPADKGLFLDHTYRLHPEICSFVSELYYDNKLSSRPGLEVQRINGPEPLAGSGLRLLPIDHRDNVSESSEEVEAVSGVMDRLLEAGITWVNEKGMEQPLSLQDILVIAPYNAQVSALTASLPENARIGTVDKFQGQEAPIVIYSLATSTASDAPRGMGFLFSPNRLNVAISRARAMAVVVATPALFDVECRTPEQMKLANGYCRLLEIADQLRI